MLNILENLPLFRSHGSQLAGILPKPDCSSWTTFLFFYFEGVPQCYPCCSLKNIWWRWWLALWPRCQSQLASSQRNGLPFRRREQKKGITIRDGRCCCSGGVMLPNEGEPWLIDKCAKFPLLRDSAMKTDRGVWAPDFVSSGSSAQESEERQSARQWVVQQIVVDNS